MPTATATTNSHGTLAEAPPGVAGRVEELRSLVETNAWAARDAAWSWIGDLKQSGGSDRGAALAELGELFRSGIPPTGIDGRTEGILVTPMIARGVDPAVRAITSLWMPWMGKRFDSAANRGDNVLRNDARWPARLLWPLYGTSPLSDARAAFEFETRVEEGKDDPGLQVLVIDYSVVDSNPRLIIKSIRDELVEIVPGANLGKVLWRGDDDSYTLIGYFALRSALR
jgi:hypothetical protein